MCTVPLVLLLAVPNLAEGRDPTFVETVVSALDARLKVLDVHSDPVHNRTVMTLLGGPESLVAAGVDLARLCTCIDMTRYDGRHPALGGLDVLPLVPYDRDLDAAADVARAVGAAIATKAGTPVVYYGNAVRGSDPRDLPDIRRGGMAGLIERARAGELPDEGPDKIDPRRGVVCVGARGPLIAFNVWLECDGSTATHIARRVRTSTGGLPAVRALPIEIQDGLSQVSMNLLDPDVTGIDAAYDRVASLARQEQATVAATEIVGLVWERDLPDPKKEAARLLRVPGRSIESVVVR